MILHVVTLFFRTTSIEKDTTLSKYCQFSIIGIKYKFMHFDFGEIDSVDTKITPFANMFRFVYNDRKRQSPTVYMSTRIYTPPG